MFWRKKGSQFIRQPVCRAHEGSGGQFQHAFGGDLDLPAVPPGGSAPCHLLYTIDTDDPLFPIKIPGVRILPLIYCQQYNAAAMGYRVTSGGIEIDHIESLEWLGDFPYENYPASFPRCEILLEEVEQGVVQVLQRYIDANEPDPRDWDTIEECETELEKLDYPFTQFGGPHLMVQGVPEVACPNPACKGMEMKVFGVVWNSPVKGVYLWDNDPKFRDSSEAQIIYQICSDCSAIHACNRS